MSSLRLALKQSLAESGHVVAQQKEKERRKKEEEDRRRKDRRRRQKSRQQHQQRGESRKEKRRDREPGPSYHNSLQSHLEEGSRAAMHLSQGGSSRRSVSSSTLSSSSGSSSDSDSDETSSSSGASRSSFGSSSSDSRNNGSSSDDASTSSSDDGMEMDGVFDSEVSSDENDVDDTSSNKRRRKQQKQLEKQAQRNGAANMIQNNWKKKSNFDEHIDRAISSDRHNRGQSLSSRRGKKSRKNRRDRPEHTSDSSSSWRQPKTSGKGIRRSSKQNCKGIADCSNKQSTPSSKKTKTVLPPADLLASWSRSMSTGSHRRNIAAGLRVKVRFATKSRKDGKMTRKLKWYGGLVTDIAVGGKRIRIKYDDGTSEVADFPDKDIVVDDTENGRHRVPADAFFPPSPSFRETKTPPQSESPIDAFRHDSQERSPKQDKDDASSPNPQQHQPFNPNAAASPNSEDETPSTAAQTQMTPQSSRQTPFSLKASAAKVSPFSFTNHSGHSNSSSSSSGGSFDHGESVPDHVVGEANRKEKESRKEKSRKKFPKERKRSSPLSVESSPSFEVNDRAKLVKSSNSGSLTIKLITHKTRKEPGKYSPVPGESNPGRSDVAPGTEEAPGTNSTENIVDNTEDCKVGCGGNKDIVHNQRSLPTVPANVQSQKQSPGTTEDLSEGKNAQSSKKRSPPTLSESTEEPPPKKIILAWGKERRKDDVLSSDSRHSSKNTSASGLCDGARTQAEEVVDLESSKGKGLLTHQNHKTTSDQPETNHLGATNPSSIHDPDNPRSSSVPTSLIISLNKIKKKREREGREKSLSPVPSRRSSGSKSPKPKRRDSPTPLTSDVHCSSNNTELSKPLSTVGGALASSQDRQDGATRDFPALPGSGSRHSAFETKLHKSNSNDSLGSDLEHVSESGPTVHPKNDPDAEANSRMISIPTARSGRRAAQKANERIVAKQEIVIADEYAKVKKRKEKIESTPFPLLGHGVTNNVEDGDTGEEEEDDRWVQCDRCMKWRLLPSTVQMDKLPERWYCELNVHDPKRNSCDAPEQTADEITKEKKAQKALSITHHTKSPTASKHHDDAPSHDEFDDEEIQIKSKSMETKLDKSHERASSFTNPAEDDGKEIADSAAFLSSDTKANKKSKDIAVLSANDRENLPSSPRSVSTEDSRSGAPTRAGPTNGAGKKGSGLGDECASGIVNAGGIDIAATSGVPSKSKSSSRSRNRSRGGKDGEKGSKPGKSSKKEKEPQEWVQCEKCEKWRRLPPRISAKDLPEVWYCTMNTWDPRSASCNIEEDKIDTKVREYTIFGSEATANAPNSSGSSGKLSYRNLIFGTGRKHSRPISERARASESLFAVHPNDGSTDGSGPPTVMYTTSSAFLAKGGSSSSKALDESNRSMSFLDLMSHSKLWAELYSGHALHLGLSPNGLQNGHTPQNVFKALPEQLQTSMKSLVYHALGNGSLAGHEVLLEVQCRQWNDSGHRWSELRTQCTLELVTAALEELEKDGLVEIIRSQTTDKYDVDLSTARYRRIAKDCKSRPSSQDQKQSRCMKIAKPWKKARTY